MTRFPRFHRTGRLATQRIVVAIVTVSAAGALARPAAAQVYWGDSDRYHGDRYRNNNYNDYNYRRRQYQQHDFFLPFSGFMRPPPVVDSTKAPPPRKLEQSREGFCRRRQAALLA